MPPKPIAVEIAHAFNKEMAKWFDSGGCAPYPTVEELAALIASHLEPLRKSGEALVAAMETCHICHGSIIVDEGPNN